jgi:hypothetical protein
MLDEIACQNMIQRRNRAKKLYNILKELYPKEYECRESLAILKALQEYNIKPRY